MNPWQITLGLPEFRSRQAQTPPGKQADVACVAEQFIGFFGPDGSAGIAHFHGIIRFRFVNPFACCSFHEAQLLAQ